MRYNGQLWILYVFKIKFAPLSSWLCKGRQKALLFPCNSYCKVYTATPEKRQPVSPWSLVMMTASIAIASREPNLLKIGACCHSIALMLSSGQIEILANPMFKFHSKLNIQVYLNKCSLELRSRKDPGAHIILHSKRQNCKRKLIFESYQEKDSWTKISAWFATFKWIMQHSLQVLNFYFLQVP